MWKRLGLLATLALAAGCSSGSSGGGGGLKPLSGPQTGSLAIQLANGNVNTTTKPQAIQLQGTAVYDDPADRVTLSLTITNQSTELLSSPKVLIQGLSEGTVAGDGSFGLVSADGEPAPPYVYYGPESIEPGGSVVRDVVIDGVLGAQPTVGVDVEIVMHGWFFSAGDFSELAATDASGVGQTLDQDVGAFGFLGDSGSETKLRPVSASADGRTVYFVCRNQPAVGAFDLVERSLVLTSLVGSEVLTDGMGPVGHTAGMRPSPDGALLYATLNDGAHQYRFSGTYPPPAVRLVQLEAETLSVVSTLELVPAAVGVGAPPQHRGRRISTTADGTRGAMAVTDLGVVFWIDLETMTLLDADPLTPGDQGFDVSGTSVECRIAAISPDGAQIAVAYARNDGTLDLIDTATGTISPLVPPDVSYLSPEARATLLEYGPDGRLYYGRRYGVATTSPGLAIYDPVSFTWIDQPEVGGATGIAFTATSYCVTDVEDELVHCFALASDEEIASEGGGVFGIPQPQAGEGQGLVLTLED
ncbi:MAG: hypothetical protein AAF682_30620 [Planctomycetota bacterium]